jgi:small subunit ribosomal protein S11
MARSKSTKNQSAKSVKSKKAKKVVYRGRIYMYASYNNTILTFTDDNGDILAWSSAGVVGFSGARKSTPYAAQKAAENLNSKIAKFGVKEVDVYIKGAGAAKQLALKELSNGGYRICSLIDNNPVRMGGTRPRKRPRK